MSTPIFEILRQRMVQLLNALERDNGLAWSLRQTIFLDQRFYQIHQRLVLSFAEDGILQPPDAASRQSDRLFREFGELMSELEDDSALWTAGHRDSLSHGLRQVHDQFSQLLEEVVDRTCQEQMSRMRTDLIRHVERFFSTNSNDGGQP